MADQDGEMMGKYSNVKPPIESVKVKLSMFWQARNPRERAWLSIASVVALLGLFYGFLLDPALSGRSALSKALPQLRQQMAQLQAMTREANALSAGDALAPFEVSKKNIEVALARNGLRAQSIAVTDDAVRVQLSKVAYSDVLAWLNDMQKVARLTLIDAAFIANGEADSVDARLTLHRLQKDEQT